MRVVNYISGIKENEDELNSALLSCREPLAKRRLRFLISLKSGCYPTRKEAGAAIGLSPSGADKLWTTYQKLGLERLLRYPYQGKASLLNEAGREALLSHLKEDTTATLSQARDFIEQHTGVHYSISAVHYICRSLKVKKKTGCPANVRKEEAGAEIFKKDLSCPKNNLCGQHLVRR